MSLFLKNWSGSAAGATHAVCLTIALAAAAAAPGAARGDHKRESGSLAIAVVSSNQIVIEFEAPTRDLLGFDHEPTTADDHDAFDDAVGALSLPVILFGFPLTAGCVVEDGDVQVVVVDPDHAVFKGDYVVRCVDPDAVSVLDLAYFDAFPDARELEITLISDQGAALYRADPRATLIDLDDLP